MKNEKMICNIILIFDEMPSLVFDLNAYWRISESVTLNAAVNNLTDETYFNFQDVRGKDNDDGDILRYSMPERNFQVGVKFSF